MAKLKINRHEKMGYNPARDIDFYRVHFDIVGQSSTLSDYLVLYVKRIPETSIRETNEVCGERKRESATEVNFGWFGKRETDEIDFHWKSSLSERLMAYMKANSASRVTNSSEFVGNGSANSATE